MSSPIGPGLHDAVTPLGFLLGTWNGRGHGEYPTIESFDYDETITFGHVGKPFLSYAQRTTSVPGGLPLHAETGYLRLAAGRPEWVLAHPSGIVEIEEGSFIPTPAGGRLELATTCVRGTSTAKRVDGLERSIEVDGDVLRYRVAMAAVGLEMVHHLDAELHRIA